MSQQREKVWVSDEREVFVQGQLVERKVVKNKQGQEQAVAVVSVNGKETEFSEDDVASVNPSTFDKVDDLSELTHLNEASVLFNLQNRYQDDLIYTYSGLFLVAINPYSNIKIYSNSYIKLYHGSPKEDNKPHIFAVAEQAYQNLLHQKQDQSILVTGESGAGKTENTKKILQYLASITTDDKILLNQTNESFERKILQSNPILESFGNAQTVRNNNSSRFGKFIKIDFDEYGKINGAHIEWYLLEKSRVIQAHARERNYHIFYQILSGMSKQELRAIGLESNSIVDYQYLRHSNPSIPGIDDGQNYQELVSAFETVGFTKDDIQSILKCISIILHIGNVEFVSERSEQASIKNDIKPLCKLLGVQEDDFKSAVLKPKSKAGKEWVSQAKNASQARSILNSLSRSLYEKLFEYIVNQINKSLEHGSMTEYFIGLLDIAGFEIFKDNSFEQLCINYTNEKLQQFFNHHMFVLEQNEYQKEDIQWNFIDYGKDLQTTIDLIEQKNSSIPGILPILEEESILPKSSDASFYSKLLSSWDNKSTKFKRSKLDNCFILKHYAGDVEYNVTDWLSKNKDPLNENLLQVLNDCANPLVSQFFADRIRGSSFRTSSNKHREQLHTLIEQLGNTDPHFVRCIIPNNKKKAGDFDKKLILDQLRCNGVLEGIRIARDGYPNRIFFKEFFQRYKILSDECRFTNNSKKNCEILLSSLHLDPTIYKVGNTKLFFKAGVLANLELLKEQRLSAAVTRLNAIISANSVRKEIRSHLKKLQAARILKVTFETYDRLMENPWYNLYMKLLPLLDSSNTILKTKKIAEQVKQLENKLAESEKSTTVMVDAKRLVEQELEKVKALLLKETSELQQSQELLEATKTKQIQIQQKWDETLSIKDSLETENLELSKEADNLRLELEKTKNASDLSEDKFRELSHDKEKLEITVNELKNKLDVVKNDERALDSEKDKLIREISDLKKEIQEKTMSLKDMEAKVNDSEIAIDVKLKSLEKHLAATSNRMKGFFEENTQLAAQVKSLKNDIATKNSLFENKSAELNRVNVKVSEQESMVNSLSKEKESLLIQVLSLSKELKAVRQENDSNKCKLESINEEYSKLLAAKQENGSSNGNHELNKLKTELLQEQSMNKFLNERLLSVGRSGKAVNGFSSSVGTDDLRREFDELSMKYKDVEMRLTSEIEEKKNLISRLRFAETRLASASFDNQTLTAQLKKIKQLSKSTLSEVNLDEELENIDKFELNQEKMLLEIDFLKRQLTKEMNARKNAERVASALHQKVGQIQRSDSSADIFKLRYEANEDYVKSLEMRQNSSPFRDKTNIINGDIFKHRESFEKYEEELQPHRVESNRLHSSLVEYQNKLHDLTLDYNKSLVTEASLREQIAQLDDELKTVEQQKNMIQSNSKRYQTQYEGSQRDLVTVESEVRAVKHGLKQAEKDIESMTQMIQKLRSQNKQKEQEIWQQETKITELESQLDEKTIELDKSISKSKALEEDITHYKERARAVENNKEYLVEIDCLKGKLDGYLRLETEMKKEMSSLGYQLETLKLDSEAKIQDLLKQTNHYERLVTELGIQKDEAEAAKKTLETTIKTLQVKNLSLEETTQSLSAENKQLQEERTFLRSKLDEANGNFSQSLKEKEKYSHDVQFLEESLALQKQQAERNEELIDQLQTELDTIKTTFSSEKDKNANLFQENASLAKANEILRNDLLDAKNKLADTSENDAWFNKVQTLTTTLEEERTSKFEEIKKSKKLERIIEELERKNEEQANVIEIANDAKSQYEETIGNLDEKLGEIEAINATKDATLNKMHRDNTYYQEQISELEKEISSWKQRYEKLSERRQSLAQSTDGVFI